MKQQAGRPTDDWSEDLQKLEDLFANDDNSSPPQWLNKQILSAANREIEQASKPREYFLRGWKKWSLPLYAATGMAFSFIAIQAIWTPLVNQPANLQSTPSDTVQTEIIVTEPEPNLDRVSTPRKQRKLPVLDTNEVPQSIVSSSEVPELNPPIDLNNLDVPLEKATQEKEQNAVYTGGELVKSVHPERQAWAQKIISLVKSDKREDVLRELTAFKRVYPEYPIDEQIKSISQ